MRSRFNNVVSHSTGICIDKACMAFTLLLESVFVPICGGSID